METATYRDGFPSDGHSVKGTLRPVGRAQSTKRGTSTWYTERGTYTEPSSIEGMEWICRCGKRIALVPIKKES